MSITNLDITEFNIFQQLKQSVDIKRTIKTGSKKGELEDIGTIDMLLDPSSTPDTIGADGLVIEQPDFFGFCANILQIKKGDIVFAEVNNSLIPLIVDNIVHYTGTSFLEVGLIRKVT